MLFLSYCGEREKRRIPAMIRMRMKPEFNVRISWQWSEIQCDRSSTFKIPRFVWPVSKRNSIDLHRTFVERRARLSNWLLLHRGDEGFTSIGAILDTSKTEPSIPFQFRCSPSFHCQASESVASISSRVLSPNPLSIRVSDAHLFARTSDRSETSTPCDELP